ncbi:hypothetical protein [uncultured Prevotella sp.]|uniref:hypothetical protein n=1 Tax=uncultured Prevotella sp. TaxID=159272 RepID=UPI0025CF8B84|nr:hypothetical protein [uncultured Prevotella sp.]
MFKKILEKPLSYWLDQNDNNVYYVLYNSSYVLWDNVLLGKINTSEGNIPVVYNYENTNGKSIIHSFITDTLSQNPVKYKQLDDSLKNNKQIKEHINAIISNENKNSPNNLEIKQLLLHIKSDSCSYSYANVEYMSVDEIVSMIKQDIQKQFRSANDLKSLYCGITNDIDLRMEQHRINDFSIVDGQVYAYVCANAIVAKRVLYKLEKNGYNIGEQNAKGNVAVQAQFIVYILKIECRR